MAYLDDPELPADDARRAWLATRHRTIALQIEACSPRASRHHVERMVELRRLRRRLETELRSPAR